MEKLEKIYKEMIKISGPHTKIIGNTNLIRDNNEIYASFHYPNFTKTNSQRNTLVRFDEFLIDNLNNKIVFDIGSNIGALSFEALRRNALKVVGFEYCIERVNICNELKNELKVNGDFYKYDFNNLDEEEFLKNYQKADIVFCCAIDAYINNKLKFYKFISNICNETCYFETNSKINNKEFTEIMEKNGFKIIINLGMSKSDKGYGINSYILIKNSEKLKQRENDNIYHKKIFKWNNYYIYQYDNNVLFNKIKNLYERIKDIEYVQQIKFYDNNIMISPKYENPLDESNFSIEDKKLIKKQLIDFIKKLNERKIAHRDLHIRNACFHNKKLIIIDWEFIENNNCELKNSYDLTGFGLLSPLKSDKMNLLKDHTYSFKNFFNNELTINDFINK